MRDPAVTEVATPAEESVAISRSRSRGGSARRWSVRVDEISPGDGSACGAASEQADRDTVAQLAKDYALKSLTYTFEDPDAFFRSVEDGVSQQLKDKYVNATDLLKSIMLQAQVTSSGEVLATDPVAQPGGAYQVVVSAHQTTRNLQNPTPKVSIILLQVTVNKAGNHWQVSDIGPKTGSHPPIEDQIPPPEPAPAPGPAPANPTPKP